MSVKSVLAVVLGFVFLGIGAVGAFLPILPTTPFVLLAAVCFSGTPRLREKIMRIGFFREHLENYEKRIGLPKRTVVASLVFLWGMMLISMLRIRKSWVIALLVVIGIGVTVHILWMAKPKREASGK
ncbi:YbaN family protein [Synergistaceae bacterium OttesenSCG-928-I11]|nr:YbaN family protein [Synergistaceae bacterium OttesenSCG-928-I11]